MRILALDLSSARGSLAWLSGDADQVRDWPNDRKNSSAFFEQLVVMRREFGTPERIIVGLGPGSYAGTRIGISAAVGLKVASQAQLVGHPSICVMDCDETEYCVIGDARRQSFFFAHIRENTLVEGPTLCSETELRDKVDNLDAKISIFCSEKLSQVTRAVITYPSARLLARLAQDTNRSFVLPPLEPMYLREPHITTPRPLARST